MFVLLAVGLLLGLIAVASGSGDPATGESRSRIVVPAEPNATLQTYDLLTGIPQHGSVLGYPKAPVTLQFFGDLQCKESREVMLGALPYLIRHWVRGGQLRIRYRSMETDTRWGGGWLKFREQQGAALAAGEQGRLWNFVDVFYRDQGPEYTGYVDEAFLNRIAVQAGIDLGRWQQARTPPERWVPQLQADERLHNARGLVNTPSFLIGPTAGKAKPLRHFGLDEPQVFDEAVARVLRQG